MEKTLHLIPADAPVGIQYKDLVFQHGLKNLQQTFLPGVIGLFPL